MDELTHEYALEGHLTKETDFVDRVTITVWGGTCCGKSSMTLPDGTCFAYTYDAMGCQTAATDAVGTTTFTYAPYGQLLSEQVSGLYSKTLTRHYDAFGRNVGYSVDNERKQSIVYAPATGRLATMGDFAWEYLPGSHLKSCLTYPNGATAEWDYEPTRNLLARVTNTINGTVASQYTYTNDLLGRRTAIGKSGSMMAADETQPYGYNVRDEPISADEVSYNYDDIGNRTTAEGKTYTANNLNQYTAIDDFVPEYDADGNQTLVKTSTGIWSVVYNAENRPVRWQSGDTVITMAFDRMGRRVEMRTVKDGAETLQRFVYDNYLCIQQLRGTDNALFHSYVWDPTEPIATRPLIFIPSGGEVSYYFHDGNKNVSDLVDTQGNIVQYDYMAFGTSTSTAFSENPYRFSSEVYDDGLDLVYYNYRHYNSRDGRWNERDKIYEFGTSNLYSIGNPLIIDILGLQKAYAENVYHDIYELKINQCQEENGCYRWKLLSTTELVRKTTTLVIAKKVWSNREKWKAFLESCGERFIPTLDEFVNGQLSNATVDLLAERFPGIKSGMSFASIMEVLYNVGGVVKDTFTPPRGAQHLFGNGDYYQIIDSKTISRESLDGIVDARVGSHQIVKTCGESNVNAFYNTAVFLRTETVELGKWEK